MVSLNLFKLSLIIIANLLLGLLSGRGGGRCAIGTVVLILKISIRFEQQQQYNEMIISQNLR